MFDAFTILVYFGILGCALLFTFRRNLLFPSNYEALDFTQDNRLDLNYGILLTVMCVVIGLRFNVGVDWGGYAHDYEQMRKASVISFSDQYFEVGFYLISKFFTILNQPPQWMFFTMALISWYFFFRSVPREILFFVLFFTFTEEFFFWSMNGVRQFSAMCIWLFSLKYLSSGNFKKYLVFTLLACCFHLSAFLLIPLYFLKYKRILNPVFFVPVFILLFLLPIGDILNSLIGQILALLGPTFELAYRYLRYVETDQFGASEMRLGPIFYLKLITSLLIILLSKPVLVKYKQLRPYYGLFAFGAILYNVFYDNQLVSRFLMYFLFLKPVLIAITVIYYWDLLLARLPILAFSLISILILLYAIFNSSNLSSPFRFDYGYL